MPIPYFRATVFVPMPPRGASARPTPEDIAIAAQHRVMQRFRDSAIVSVRPGEPRRIIPAMETNHGTSRRRAA